MGSEEERISGVGVEVKKMTDLGLGFGHHETTHRDGQKKREANLGREDKCPVAVARRGDG